MKDYVIYDKANDTLVKFSNGEIILYADRIEAWSDAYRNEYVVQVKDLPTHKQEEIKNQIKN